MEKCRKRRNSEGKLVNVGNFKSDGVNVNANEPDNRNDNLGVSFSRSLKSSYPQVNYILVALIQPPSIFPISCKSSCSFMYLFSSSAFASQQSRITVCKTLSFKSILFSISTLWLPDLALASKSISSICIAKFSVFRPKP